MLQAFNSVGVAVCEPPRSGRIYILNAKPSLHAGACKQFSLTPSHRGGSKIPNVLCRLLLQPTHRVIRAVPMVATGTEGRTSTVMEPCPLNNPSRSSCQIRKRIGDLASTSDGGVVQVK